MPNKKVLFIDHGFHERTSSTKFFQDALKEAGYEIEVQYDDGYLPNPQKVADLSNIKDYEMVIAFQLPELAVKCAYLNPKRLIWVPMMDNGYGTHNFEILKENCQVLCFCAQQYKELQDMGFKKLIYFRYFPNPSDFKNKRVIDFTSVRPFFWQRRPFPSWQNVLKLLRPINYQELNVHFCPDFSNQLCDAPTLKEQADNKIRLTRWFENAQLAELNLLRSNLYFAPRDCEGIGMSFLNAMVMGIPVVALDTPTHNEYIINNYTGVLHGMGATPLANINERKLKEMSQNLSAFMETGYRFWQQEFKYWLLGCSMLKEFECPEIAIIIAVKDDKDGLLKTLYSISRQGANNFDIVVIDGSKEKLLEGIRTDYIYNWTTDKGVYDAMNKGVKATQRPYVLFLNAGDTFYSPNSLRGMYDTLKSYEEPDFVVGSTCIVHEDGKRRIRHTKHSFLDSALQIKTGKFNGFFFEGSPCHQSVLIKRQLLVDRPYNLKYQISADMDQMFGSILSGATRIVHSPAICSCFHLGGMSSKRRLRTFLDLLDILKTLSGKHRVSKKFMKPALEVEMVAQSKYGLNFRDLWPNFLQYPLFTVKQLISVGKQEINERFLKSTNLLKSPRTLLFINIANRRIFESAFTYIQTLTKNCQFAFLGTREGAKIIKAVVKKDVPVDDFEEYLQRTGRIGKDTTIILIIDRAHLSRGILASLYKIGIRQYFLASGDQLNLQRIPRPKIIGLSHRNEPIYNR